MNQLAGEAFDRRDYASALRMYTVTCAVAGRIGDEAGLATCNYDIGLSYSRLSRHDEALQFYRRALPFYEALNDHGSIVRVLNGIELQLRHGGESLEALSYFQRALHEADLSGSDIPAAQTNTNLGNLYKTLGRYREAIQCFQAALAVTRKHEMDRQSSWILNDLGDVYHDQNETELALSFHQQSLALKEKRGDPAEIASTLMNLGVDLQEMGNPAQASQYYDRVIPLARQMRNTRLLSQALYNYGYLEEARGRYPEAKEKMGSALELAESISDGSTAAFCRTDLAQMAVDEGRYAEAVPLAEAAAQYARSAGEVRALTRALDVLGKALQLTGKPAEAERAFEEAIQAVETQREQLPAERLALTRFMEDQGSPYIHMVEFQIEHSRPERALAYAERSKGRALLDVLESGRVDITKAMTPEERRREQDLARTISSLHEQMLAASNRPSPDRKRIGELRAQLDKARNEYHSFEVGLYAGHPQLKVQRVAFEPATPGELAASLPDASTALLEYFTGDAGIYLFVLSRAAAGADLRLYKLPMEPKATASAVARFREQIAGRDLEYRKPAASLYRSLIDPAREQLRGKTTLVIVPDGFLWQLPFQALEGSPGRALLEDRALVYAPSLTVLHEMRKVRDSRKPAERTLLAVDAADLPAARREVDGLRQLYGSAGVQIYSAAEADGEHIKREAPNYRLLHLAAHGVFENRNPMNSYLLLAKAGKPEGGVMEAREMMDLDLHADLVVLSGCETGRGKAGRSEGLIGMSWALFIAGSPATLASQWKVESASTTELMLEFHRNLRKASEAKALRQAALRVMKNPEYRHPFYWSGFVLMGAGL